ncbi:ABC transporter substrate-binding protein [Geosporobacter ferrireducens]|uniref:Branched-chain amino acid ABC transporter substrate-binding protein n=1 Tax=Geosporobacter ferrireducens TaxID=1424294 RepID=A0A1D8GHR6_9FIRM|nr:ABC transporter substrate-binding protein [Geosporobacter ferrireducens]AOT70448.1 branched-chain amino acid ABC transporter substrate-binding protein [Geosporobacter ferrireducens]MTI57207.1 ABC transporter substrate-binding protein [Geosporobacter ferrireducens]
MRYMGIILSLILAGVICMGCIGSVQVIRSNERIEDRIQEEETIRLGVFQPLTGAAAAGGKITLEGIQLANQLFPEVLGKKIELVVIDNQSDRTEAANAVTKLIREEKVKAIIGSYGSSLSIAAGEIIKKEKIPTIGCSPTNPIVTMNNDYYFRVCFADPFQGTVIANYAVRDLGVQRAAIIQDEVQEYSLGLSRYFMEAFQESTGDPDSIQGVYSYHSGQKDFSAILREIKQSSADVIFAPGNHMESALLIKQAREMGIQIPFCGGDTWETPDFREIGGDAVEGVIFSSHFSKEAQVTNLTQLFLKEYEKKHQQEVNAFGALGFDAYLVLLDAIKRAGVEDPEKIRTALSDTENFEGATGKITLDNNGDAQKSAVIMKVENKKLSYVTFVEAE